MSRVDRPVDIGPCTSGMLEQGFFVVEGVSFIDDMSKDPGRRAVPEAGGRLDTTPHYLGGPISTETRINDRIRVPEVRLVGPGGEQVGIVRVEDALRLALEADLDLVEVAPDARPPVCKIMDYGKFKYEAAQKARESRKNQTLTVIKEQKLRPKIDAHDYETKKRNVVRFLEAGSKVKVTIMFRGREQSRPELGFRLLQRLGADVADLGFVETSAKQDGRNMTMVLAPHKGAKTRVKAQESAAAPPAQRASAPAEPAAGDAPAAPPAS
ncbi:translation initiation factor IF-3 [Rhodococcoides kyotonense]|uniref:Translation initiation factor IF-3 n=2 Tax=Rhodococcoides kyotonense TaxID=398843 RepID=A0A239KRV1_9NOCA|nr:translation initiation factor IF-3 [Rhodococcus kyotonensis]